MAQTFSERTAGALERERGWEDYSTTLERTYRERLQCHVQAELCFLASPAIPDGSPALISKSSGANASRLPLIAAPETSACGEPELNFSLFSNGSIVSSLRCSALSTTANGAFAAGNLVRSDGMLSLPAGRTRIRGGFLAASVSVTAPSEVISGGDIQIGELTVQPGSALLLISASGDIRIDRYFGPPAVSVISPRAVAIPTTALAAQLEPSAEPIGPQLIILGLWKRSN